MKDSIVRHKRQIIPIVAAFAAIIAYATIPQASAQFTGGIRSGNLVGNQLAFVGSTGSGNNAVSGPGVGQQFGTGNNINSGNVHQNAGTSARGGDQPNSASTDSLLTQPGQQARNTNNAFTSTQASNAGGVGISGPANAGNTGSGPTGNQFNLAGDNVPFQNSFNHIR